MSRLIDLTQKIIQCPSVTPEDAGAQDVLKQPLQKMGFTIHDLPFEGQGGSYPVKNFFARLGNQSPHLCYSGHTDVVPAGDESLWTYPPFSGAISGEYMYGRGTSDMKGANIAFIIACENFLGKFPDFIGSISFLITGDEEAESINGTVRVVEWMRDNNHLPSVCLVGESSNITELGEEIKIGRRGSLSGTLTVTGKQGHVAYPNLADNPIPKLARLVSLLDNFTLDTGNKHFPASNLEFTTIDVGNKTGNVIPAKATARFNIRYNTLWTQDSLIKKLHDILGSADIGYDLQTKSNAKPFLTTASEWVHLVQKSVTKVTGKIPILTTSGGTSDARFVAPYCPVVEFGLTNKTIHQIDECLKISDLEKLVKIYEDILLQYFHKQ